MPVATDARPAPSRSTSNLDVGFLGLALYGGLAHANILYSRAFYQGFAGFATAVANGLQMRWAMPR